MSKEYLTKTKFIIKIKKYFGKDSIIEDFTGYSKVNKGNDYDNEFDKLLSEWINIFGSFRNKNLICVLNPKNNDKFWIFFHYSENIGFYGFDKVIVDEMFNLQNNDKTGGNLSFLVLFGNLEKEVCFLIPIYLIKRIENNISVSKEDSIQLKLNLVFKNNKYLLKLLRNYEEDISSFKIKINQLFDKLVYKKFNEEKEKYKKLYNVRADFKRKFLK